MKKRMLALFFVLFLLAGCQTAAPEETSQTVTYDWMAGESPVPQERLGIKQQGIYGLENSYECTEDGVYFMTWGINGGEYLLYGDHGSDTIIKLCGRSDCTHDGGDCNARFFNGLNICWYDGYLYATEGPPLSRKLVRMNPDGTDRVTVLETSPIFSSSGYGGSAGAFVGNGVFMFCPGRLDSEGVMQSDMYYYKLDGSMEEPAQADFSYVAFSDGDDLLMSKNELPTEYELWRWNPEDGTGTFVTDVTGPGYYASDAAYYIRDGVVYRMSYAAGTEEALTDTGLLGNYRLMGFPDCFVIASRDDGAHADRNLYIYNWAYERVATVELTYPLSGAVSNLIAAETPERIILADGGLEVPRYYIEKSEFGTGSVTIYEYNLPDLTDYLEERAEELAGEEEGNIINDDNW